MATGLLLRLHPPRRTGGNGPDALRPVARAPQAQGARTVRRRAALAAGLRLARGATASKAGGSRRDPRRRVAARARHRLASHGEPARRDTQTAPIRAGCKHSGMRPGQLRREAVARVAVANGNEEREVTVTEAAPPSISRVSNEPVVIEA